MSTSEREPLAGMSRGDEDDPAQPRAGHGDGHGGGHEDDVLPWRPVLWATGVVSFLLVVGFAVPTFMERKLFEYEARQSPPANPLVERYGRQIPPPPRLQVNPARDIAELRRSTQEILTTYGWVDEQAGIVRIPISRAIDLLAKDGGGEAAYAPAAAGGEGEAAGPGSAAGGRNGAASGSANEAGRSGEESSAAPGGSR